MENYFYEEKQVSIDEYYRQNDHCWWCDRVRQQYLPYNDCIIVYLEDYECKSEEGGRDDEYRLLLDFFTFSDYIRFREILGNRTTHHKENREESEDSFPHSTFFTIDNYRTKDKPQKDAHYYLNLYELKGVEVKTENDEEGVFPLLCSFLLPSKAGDNQTNDRLLYLTQPLIYPQMVFRRFYERNVPAIISNVEKVDLLAWNVGQGNCNEIRIGGEKGEPYVIFDAGTDILRDKKQFANRKRTLESRLMKGELPLLVISHWHTDHYSLLIAQSDKMLSNVMNYMMPSYVKSLSVFLFIARLKWLGKSNIDMVKLPYSSRWLDEKLNETLMLYANRYEHNNVNDSGLTLFVKGPNGNAMLPGDCKYALAEGETNEAIEKMGAKSRNLCLMIPHHGGNAGKSVSYKVSDVKAIEGIVSVGVNGYGHPKTEVMDKIRKDVPKIRKTDTPSNLNGGDCIEVGL